MINVTIGESKTQSEKPFPKLMKSISSELVLFMVDESYGFVVRASEGYNVGFYSESWDTNVLYDYNEPITLQNA